MSEQVSEKHAELRACLSDLSALVSVNPRAQMIIDLLADYDALHAEAEALRAENGRLRDKYDRDVYGLNNEGDPIGGEPAGGYANDNARLRKELEAARGLLERASAILGSQGFGAWDSLATEIDALLTATLAPEVPDHIAEASKMVEQGAITVERDLMGTIHIKLGDFDAVQVRYQYPYTDNASTKRLADRIADMLRNPQAEQGERQEAVCWVPRACLDKLRNGRNNSPAVLTDGPAEFNDTPLYTAPQPGPDVRALAAALYQACGAYDMPERILDVLSAAANGESFAHMIDGLLPCVPPPDQDVRALVEALEQVRSMIDADCYNDDMLYYIDSTLSAHRQTQQGDSNDT